MAAILNRLRVNLGEGSSLGGLLERIALVVLITAAGGLLFLLLLTLDLQIPREWLKYVLLAALGLAAGLGARLLLAGRVFALKYFSGLVALLIALAMLNVASRGFVGLDILQLYPAATAWDGALSFAISAVVAWLALQAWTRPRRLLVEPRTAPTPAPTPAPRPAPRAVTRQGRTGPSLISSFKAWRARTGAQLARLMPASDRSGTAGRRKAAKPRPSPRPAHRSRAVHLSGTTEHMCPYCLEPVVRNDRRGVKICKVCKTWHHADCWAITGVCQVPHQYVN